MPKGIYKRKPEYAENISKGRIGIKFSEEHLKNLKANNWSKDKETLIKLAMNYKPFWEAEGITLCNKCHKLWEWKLDRSNKCGGNT